LNILLLQAEAAQVVRKIPLVVETGVAVVAVLVDIGHL
jgi:hypothetical protein